MADDRSETRGVAVIVPDPNRFSLKVITEGLAAAGVDEESTLAEIGALAAVHSENQVQRTAWKVGLALVLLSLQDETTKADDTAPVELTRLPNPIQPAAAKESRKKLRRRMKRPALIGEEPVSQIPTLNAAIFITSLLEADIDETVTQSAIEGFIEHIMHDHETILISETPERNTYEVMLWVKGLTDKQIATLLRTKSVDSIRQRRRATIKRLHDHPAFTAEKIRQKFTSFVDQRSD